MQDVHRSDSAQRQHYTIDKKSFVSINPTLLYSGTLRKKQDWRDDAHHHEFLEIIFLLHGNGSVMIDDKSYHIEQGDIVIYNAGITHCEQSSTQAPIEASFLAFDKIQLKNLPPNCILTTNSAFIFKSGEYAPVLAALFNIINEEISSKKEFYVEIAKDTSHTLLMYIFRILNSAHTSLELPNKDPVLQKVLAFIDENFLKEIGLDEISAECFVNKYYLSHLFTEHLGMPVGKYIRNKRIELAKKVLSESTASIADVSDKCAFNDANYFGRVFKKSTGFTPLQYRRAYLRETLTQEDNP